MLYLRGIGPLFVFVLAMVASSAAEAATLSYGAAANAPFQNVSSVVDGSLKASGGDSGGQAARSANLTALDQADLPGATSQLIGGADDNSGEQQPELGGVIRHRGFIKVLLIVFVCGAVVRFFSSPTFLNFITDALAPKAW